MYRALDQSGLRHKILVGVAIPFALFAGAFVAAIQASNVPGIVCGTAGLLATGVSTALLARRLTHFINAVVEQQEVVQDAQEQHQKIQEQLRSVAFELEAARQLADAGSQAKSEFLARMSHEIRTPMTAVIGYADKILDVGDDPAQRRDCVRIIKRSGDHLLALINDILDLSKVEAGKMTIESMSVAPAALLADVASIMRVRAQDKGLDFAVERDGPLPERIVSDPTRLRQILINLIGNGVKFTERGGVKIVMKLDAAQSASPRLQIDVLDTGLGMSGEQINRLFRPFEQGDASTVRRFGGSGLGLCVSKRLAQLMGGTITVTSEPGAGSIFTLSVPTGSLEGVRLLDRDEDLYLSALPADETEPAMSALTGLRVLLADDTDLTRDLVRYMLERYGASVDEVSDGLQAVESARAALACGRAYDVILMDVEMPTLDGYNATSRLRLGGYRAPIIALTAHAMNDVRERCTDAGCDDFLAKPINPIDLVRVIQRHSTIALAA